MSKTRAIIDTQALQHNLQLARQAVPGCRLMAVVKADAYGHGAVPLLPVLQAHTDGLAIARLEEAEPLRKHGFNGRLLLLAGVSTPGELGRALQLQLDIVIHDAAHLALLDGYRPGTAERAHLWLKMDTGMHRLGFAPQDYPLAFARLKALPWCLSITGMTHFASADETANPKTATQLACFRQHTAGLSLDDESLANSAGLLAWPAARSGWVRPGLMLYGINPLDGVQAVPGLKPVMQLEAQVIGSKTIEAGDTVGYNDTWRATRTTRLAFIAAGYADGYPIALAAPATVAHAQHLLPVVGRVSMDTIAVDCTDSPPPAIGEWVELWGKTISVGSLAAQAGTIPYQLLTNVSARVTRCYT